VAPAGLLLGLGVEPRRVVVILDGDVERMNLAWVGVLIIFILVEKIGPAEGFKYQPAGVPG
jgi:hypothetical protein